MKINKYILGLGLLLSLSSCSDLLETNPTDRVSGSVLFSDAKNAEVAINGIYRATYVSGWTAGNTHQNFGIKSSLLCADLMADDMLQDQQGNGWFYFDYRFNSRARLDKNWRPYAEWNFHYTLISNANYIIAEEGKIPGDQVLANNVVAQAYAVRAYAYFMLAQQFARTYAGNLNAPCVPIYTDPTTAASVGKPRASVKEVYDLIRDDLGMSISLFTASPMAQKDKSNIDLYVAQGLLARVSLVTNEWQKASDAAAAAMAKPSVAVMNKTQLTAGFNDVTAQSVMWGTKIISDQATIFASFFSHMDASDAGKYGASSRKCVSSWLYDQISANDYRKAWFNGKLASNAEVGVNMSYNQFKFRFKNISTSEGDYTYMRYEEMLLIKAEADARLGASSAAVATLKTLMGARIPAADMANYNMYVDGLSTAADHTYGTTGVNVTVLDEVILQRRIELWGETGRLFDIIRLKKGFARDFANTNHSDLIPAIIKTADSKDYNFMIPQSEFDGNPNMDANLDQNPI